MSLKSDFFKEQQEGIRLSQLNLTLLIRLKSMKLGEIIIIVVNSRKYLYMNIRI